ncbi:MAG: ABC transporter permease subunit [Nocardioides sp.]
MISFTLRRLAGLVPTLFVLVTMSFFVIRLAPGGPFDQEQRLPPAIRANLDAAYGLDQPLLVQYGRYLGGLVKGDLGPSFRYKDYSVDELIGSGLPLSLTIGLAAALLAFLAGVPLGAWAAWRANSLADHAVMGFSLVGVILPGFVVGPVLALVFGIYWPVFRIAGYEPGHASFLVLPVITLALPVMAYVARLTRDSLVDVLQSNFIRTARAKGLSPATILRRHALRPALIPVVSYLGPAVAFVITGSLVVESVFGLPGSGRFLVQGAIDRDYPLVMGMILVYGVFTLVCNFIADLLYRWLDPRVRVSETAR